MQACARRSARAVPGRSGSLSGSGRLMPHFSLSRASMLGFELATHARLGCWMTVLLDRARSSGAASAF